MLILAATLLTTQDQMPKIVRRPAMHYVGVKSHVATDGIKDFMQTNIPKIFAWLEAHHIKPSGPEFLRYNVVDMAKGFELEVGVPIAKATKGGGEIQAGVIPAGRYGSLTHFGDYPELYGTNGALQNWIKAKHQTIKMHHSPKGDVFDARLEIYKSGPWNQKDAKKWETEVLFMIK